MRSRTKIVAMADSAGNYLFNKILCPCSALSFRTFIWNGSQKSKVFAGKAGIGILTPGAPVILEAAPAWRFRRSIGPETGRYSTAFEEFCVENWMLFRP